MKIMIQDRTMIIEQPRCVWVEVLPLSYNGVVVSNSKRAPILGTYLTFGRAKEVLNKMFECQENGKGNFYMPQE